MPKKDLFLLQHHTYLWFYNNFTLNHQIKKWLDPYYIKHDHQLNLFELFHHASIIFICS